MMYNFIETIAGLTEEPNANRQSILLTLNKLKQTYGIEAPKTIIEELQSNSESPSHPPPIDTIAWIRELRNELIVSLAQIDEAPKLAQTMRHKIEPTIELTVDFQSIYRKY